MAPRGWKLSEKGQASALQSLIGHGLRVEPAPRGRGDSDEWFEVRRGNVAQSIRVGQGEISAFYRLTWPWLWPAQASLFDEICRILGGSHE